MKKIMFLQLFAAIALLTACSSDDDTTVAPLPDNVYKVENTICELTTNSDATATIVMKNAKFAERMPAMDIILPNVPTFLSGTDIMLLAGSVIPEVEFGGVVGPYEGYTINNFSGKISADGSLAFQGYMHLGKIAYTGTANGNSYTGTTTTTYPNGEASTDVPVVDVLYFENTSSTAEAGENAMTITLNNVSFAQGMPAMNIRIPDIAHKENNTYYSAMIIPTVSMRGSEYMPMQQYTMTEISCTVTETSVQLSLTFPMGHLRYIAGATDNGYNGTMTFTKITE